VPKNFNGLANEALAEVARVQRVAKPVVRELLIAGHSRAYDVLNPLAMAHVDPEMANGALAKLTRVWALDTTYVCFLAEWLRWLDSKPGLEVDVVYRNVPGTGSCGKQFLDAMKKPNRRLAVTIAGAKEEHCEVPLRLRKLLGSGRS
jgi:hypothetical protein